MWRESNDFTTQLERPDWAVAEFEQATVGDGRLDRRLVSMATDFANHPGAPIPQACGTRTKINGAYNLVENDGLDPQVILLGHHQATLDRMKGHPVILLPNDTTSLNYNHLPETTGTGPIGAKSQPGQWGLFVHSTQAYTPQGRPLGVVSQKVWARPRQKTDLRTREQKPFEEKESVRWRESWQACQVLRQELPEGQVLLNIADMEGDIYEVFAEALAQKGPRVELLIRARHNRKVVDQNRRLWDWVGRQPVAATLKVRVPRHQKQPARIATLHVRFTEVEVQAPKRKADQPPLRLWAVEAREVHPPKGGEPIVWHLLSTFALTSALEAVAMVEYYAVRWSIEVFHKILKSVCRAEQHQMQTAQRLERMLMLKMLVAWRVQALTQIGREYPELPASESFSQSEWKALHAYLHPKQPVAAQEPSLGQMIHWVGRLGGFAKCKSNPHPGPIVMARGLARLSDMATIWTIKETAHAK